jgi:hypothetical protein
MSDEQGSTCSWRFSSVGFEDRSHDMNEAPGAHEDRLKLGDAPVMFAKASVKSARAAPPRRFY